MNLLLNRVLEELRKDPIVPGFSPSAKAFLRISQQPNANFDELLLLVEVDPGLTSQFIRLANSPAYQRGEPVQSVRAALLRLGTEEVCKTGMVFSIVRAFRTIKTTDDLFEFWLHSLLTARICARFSIKFKVPIDQAYLAGLLHNIGLIFLQHYFPKEFYELEQANEDLMYESELRQFDTNHAELGFALANLWKLEDVVAKGIKFHHDPDALPINDKARNLAECIHFGRCTSGYARYCSDQDLNSEEFAFLTQEYRISEQIINTLVSKSLQ
jgi:HD-like signal output (HDOD) protein